MEDDEAAAFWKKFEAETGEKVVARCVGVWYEREGDDDGVWGILILTDKSFRFRHLPSENWLASLFKSHRSTSSPRIVPEMAVPLGCISALYERKRDLLSRLFGPAFPRFELAWRPSEGAAIAEARPTDVAVAETGAGSATTPESADGPIQERRETFAADSREQLLALLRKTVPSKELPEK